MTPDHCALIERLEAMGRSHRAHESGLRKRLAAGDRSLSVQDPDNAARSAVTCEQAAAALRDQQAKMQMMQARLDRWEPRPVTTTMLPVGEHKRCNKILVALGQAYPRTCFVCRLGPCHDEIIPHALPSAPDQAKALK